MTPIRSLLIANRGEIACRVMRTAQSMGIHTVAVYSDADAAAPHVKLADEAVHIGASPVGESYLVIDKIIDAARKSGADAIHPGYGFLSERSAFAESCHEAGINFVGPSAKAIDLMGDKARAKRAMIAAGVPCVPGYQGEDQSTETLLTEAKRIGFPLMVKAAAGGGGRGMRLVHKRKDIEQAIATARSEAENAFGSGELILEKAIIRPRHVELQVIGDTHGTILHLGERDCSVQRRHQKVIEEAPCPVMTPELRQQMGEAAIAAAQAVDYVGAGTVEFLLDEQGAFYFLEMNTRLQVEHPVTEQVTGLDLVALQLHVAQGHPLGLTQDEIRIEGHAIEARLYAEDPAHDFLPASGPVHLWVAPSGDGVRVDAGLETGGEISPFYDPMVAKIIATGANREDARRRLIKGLQGSVLVGLANNRDFLINALERDAFVEGRATTAFIAEEYGDEGYASQPTTEEFGLAALLQHLQAKRAALQEALPVSSELLDWTSAGNVKSVHVFEEGECVRHVEVLPLGAGQYAVECDGEEMAFDAIHFDPPHAVCQTPSGRLKALFHSDEEAMITVATPARQFVARSRIPGDTGDDGAGSGRVAAPMHGRVLDILVKVGDRVEKDQRLAVMEAMKMQHDIRAGVSGMVVTVNAEIDHQVAADDILLEIEPEPEGGNS